MFTFSLFNNLQDVRYDNPCDAISHHALQSDDCIFMGPIYWLHRSRCHVIVNISIQLELVTDISESYPLDKFTANHGHTIGAEFSFTFSTLGSNFRMTAFLLQQQRSCA